MAGVAFIKWLLPLCIGGALGLFFWSGMSVLTLKTVILWLLITFGFLTLILHAFGSSMLGLLGGLLGFGKGTEEKQASFSDEELSERRHRALAKKQGVFDQKNHQYKENLMIPRQEIEFLKKQAEFQKFHPHWKGEGHRLGNTAPDLTCSCGQSHKIDTDIDGDSLLDYIEDSQSEAEQEEQIESKPEQTTTSNENTVRQRKKNKMPLDTQTDCDASLTKENTFYLNEEPVQGSPGTITVALRCPNGETKKRRFHIDSHIQVLFNFAEALGYASTDYCIMTTYPRKPLTDVTQTLIEAGLTQDIVLVIDDKEE